MKELIWMNGRVMPPGEAQISVEDRGFQFGDGVYEVTRVYHGRCFALTAHLERLQRSAAGINITLPLPKSNLAEEIEKLVDQSELEEGIVYLQLTRGCCPRNHLFPSNAQPTLLFYTRQLPAPPPPGAGSGVALLSVPDVRWRLCWIKSIALLANVLAKNTAAAVGAEEAVFVDNGIVSECSASNLIVVINRKIITHPVGERVLPGITRALLLQSAHDLGFAIEERPVSEIEAIAADEIFITSTTREVNWVSKWNGTKVGGGKCGPVTLQLHRALQERVRLETSAAIGG